MLCTSKLKNRTYKFNQKRISGALTISAKGGCDENCCNLEVMQYTREEALKDLERE